MNSKVIIFGIAAILAAAGAGFFLLQKDQLPESQNQPITSKAPSGVFALNLESYDGKVISLADLKGKPLVINSWAAWCPFCRKELVDFAAAQKEFTDRVVIIAVDRAESRDTAKKYSDELGVSDDILFLLDPSDGFYRSIGGFSMPETIFVDKDGNTKIHKRGPMDINEIRQKINEIL